jgi:3-hydroxyisobutyrate dehydrogenase-like beta-hydroxyacid dehydrogenase
VAAEADVLITVLPGPGEVRDVMTGRGGVLAVLPATATWIDMTGSSPAVGQMLLTAARARGISVLEAPVGGGVPEARAGTLQLFVGGDIALVERHRALLEVLADPQRITHVGGNGAGYLAKLLVNLLWFGQAVATAEACFGLDRCCEELTTVTGGDLLPPGACGQVRRILGLAGVFSVRASVDEAVRTAGCSRSVVAAG